MSSDRRDTVVREPNLVTDPEDRARAEARNGLRQIDLAIEFTLEGIERKQFRFRPSMLQRLQGVALDGLTAYAGIYRPGSVEIRESKHVPPPAHLVAELIEDMCEYVNEKWQSATAIHLAAYVMWRLNWIHPFADGNGRTSRVASFIVLSVRAGFIPSGKDTVPAQIERNRQPYFDALEAADDAFAKGKIDVSQMEDLIGRLLAHQLTSFFESAGGKLPSQATE
jgi:Fic family protein